jgi:hypothetical protein
MLARNELADYIADNYGACDRGTDCYWGKDTRGGRNGCLYTGWKGRECRHWHPVAAQTWDELKGTYP